ncbi:hypothetical protein FMUND_15427 [Fusarium mundagurra]|uniref:Uncharacterized protein n=1 Tax=Fusarium mundagurra TaxID=1567541 RepID=A0A8H6CY95_9HYPO|nr:hypothetical protein FMUND_15427 [Fusarium mundagurra]
MESKSHHLLKTDATRPQTPENRVANDQLNQVTTPVGRTVPSHGKCISTSLNRELKLTFDRTPDTVVAFLDEANICWSPAVLSFSRNYPTFTDDRLQSEIEDLKAQYQSGDQHVSQNHSKSFWDFLSLRNFILVVAFAFLMLVAFVTITTVFVTYIAPPLLELNDMMGVQTSEVKIHDVAVRGPNSVWDPHGGPASPLASASGAILSLVLKVVSAWVEYAEDIAWIFLFSRLQY